MEENNNALNWYNFKDNSNILEIGTNLNSITELLVKKANKLLTINSSEEEIEKLEEKFDYVIFYNLNEVKYLKKLLKNDGIAILIVDNKFAISAFAGSKPQEGKIFDSIMKDDKKTFSKNSIEKKLKEYNFTYNFYYLLPNYRMPNVIFSDRYMPNENTTKLMYNISYLKGSAIVFDELNALKQITKDGQFSNFANSYLVEINNKEDNQAKFISFNNSRKSKYRLITKIYNGFVEKTYCSEDAKKHIENIEKNSIELGKLGFNVIDKRKENSIFSKYIETQTFDKKIIKHILNNEINKAYELIENWYNFLRNKLLNTRSSKLNPNIKDIDMEKIKELHILQYGYIDIVFENIFFEDNQYILFDQEWYMEDIPLEFILYRAINNLYIYNQEINEILPYENIMNKFNLTSYLQIFKKIEEYFQNEIIDQNMKKNNQKSLSRLVDINSIALMKTQINDFEENDIKQNEYIKNLENDVKRLNELSLKQQKYIKYLEERRIRTKIKKMLKGNK